MSLETLSPSEKQTWRVPSDLEAVCGWYLEGAKEILAEARKLPPTQQVDFIRHEFVMQGIDPTRPFEEFDIGKMEEQDEI